MTIRIKGSAFNFGNPAEASDVTLQHFFEYLFNKGLEIPWPCVEENNGGSEKEKRLYLGNNNTHWFGVFISARPSDFQHFVKKEKDKIRIEARSLQGDRPIEMNFFCLRTDSWKGIYSHYMGSYPFSQFLKDLWNSYRFFVETKKQDRINQMEEAENRKKLKQINKSYSLHSKKHTNPLVTPTEFGKLLDRFSHVDEIRYTTYDSDEPDFEPISPRVRSVHKIVRLQPKTKMTKKIKQYISQKRGDSARHTDSNTTKYSGVVEGIDNENNPLSVYFGETMLDYLRYTYEQIGNFEIASINSHEIVKQMISQMKNAPLFGPGER